jgi:hypothetical protein
MSAFFQVIIPWMVTFAIGLFIAWLIWGNDNARQS